MLVVISPAKRLDWSEVDVETTAPAMQEEALRLAKTARNLTLGDLKGLMGLSDDLARLNRDRFKAFAAEPAPEATRPAVFGFAGDTYQGLEARSLEPDELRYAQDHLRVLSGLYGVLRPLDAIQPYRLEMGTKMATRRGESLYEFWGAGIADQLNTDLADHSDTTVVNLASNEYSKAVNFDKIKGKVITPIFKDLKFSFRS